MTRESYDKATELFSGINNYKKAIRDIEDERSNGSDIFIMVRPNYGAETRIHLYDEDRKFIIDFMKEKLNRLNKELEEL